MEQVRQSGTGQMWHSYLILQYCSCPPSLLLQLGIVLVQYLEICESVLRERDVGATSMFG